MAEVVRCDNDPADEFGPVVIEIRTRTLRYCEWRERMQKYEVAGAEEYYLINTEWPMFVEGWVREGDRLRVVEDMESWVSPRLKIRFGIVKGEVQMCGPGGQAFLAPAEQRAEKLAAKLRAVGIDPDTV